MYHNNVLHCNYYHYVYFIVVTYIYYHLSLFLLLLLLILLFDESECNGDTKIISTLRLLLLHLYTHIYS